VTKLAEIGLTEDGRPVRVLLLRRNVLVGGIAGAGKSGILNIIIATLAACPDVVLWGIDLKGGMELQPWAACFDRLATTPEAGLRTKSFPLFRWCLGETGGMRAVGIPVPAAGAAGFADAGF
jgi:hypothetical protein